MKDPYVRLIIMYLVFHFASYCNLYMLNWVLIVDCWFYRVLVWSLQKNHPPLWWTQSPISPKYLRETWCRCTACMHAWSVNFVHAKMHNDFFLMYHSSNDVIGHHERLWCSYRAYIPGIQELWKSRWSRRGRWSKVEGIGCSPCLLESGRLHTLSTL